MSSLNGRHKSHLTSGLVWCVVDSRPRVTSSLRVLVWTLTANRRCAGRQRPRRQPIAAVTLPRGM